MLRPGRRGAKNGAIECENALSKEELFEREDRRRTKEVWIIIVAIGEGGGGATVMVGGGEVLVRWKIKARREWWEGYAGSEINERFEG